MTLPTLTPCPKPDCLAPITRFHGDSGDLYACFSAMNGRPCPHGAGGLPCYAPRVPVSPQHLPDVDTVARVIYESDGYPTTSWDTQSEGAKDEYRRNARDVLDLITAHQPIWKQVEPGTLIKEGARYRHECENGEAVECIAAGDFFIGNSASFYVLHTAPAPTLTERIRAALDDSPESRITLDVADVEALLDMAGGECK